MKKTILAVGIAATSMTAVATEWKSDAWADNSGSTAVHSISVVDGQKVRTAHNVSIGTDKSGFVRIYFTSFEHIIHGDMMDFNWEAKRYCDFSEYHTRIGNEHYFRSKGVYRINGQNVKMTTYCKAWGDNGSAIEATAETSRGRSFIVKQFEAGKPVTVELNGDSVVFSSEGFTNIWENTVNKAIKDDAI